MVKIILKYYISYIILWVSNKSLIIQYLNKHCLLKYLRDNKGRYDDTVFSMDKVSEWKINIITSIGTFEVLVKET